MTSSVQPPVLKPSLGTPSNEWAKEITASIDPSSRETPQNITSGQAISQSPGVTPGNELPGAFPNRGQGETSTDATNITETIVDTAKYYLPTSVANTVETFLGGNNNNNNSTGTTGTDKEVRASEHDVFHKTSLPSQELRGTLPREHIGGVGSLPGASIERSVALLPDEEAEWSKSDTFAGRNTPGYQTPSNLRGDATSLPKAITQKATELGVSAGVVKADVPPKQATEDTAKPDVPPKQTTEDVGEGYPETLTGGEIADARQAIGNIKPVAFDIKQAHDVSMPSTEVQGQQPGEHTEGVGSLPGSKDEQDVAVLPEERATKTTEMVRPDHHDEPGDLSGQTKKPTGTSGVGVSGATDPLKDAKRRDTQRLRHPDEPTIQLEPRVYPLGGEGSHWHGVNFGREATEEWERTTAFTNGLPTETLAPEPKTVGSEPGQSYSALNEPENPPSVQKSGGSEGSAEGQRKASLKEKISGGMKVVSGKLGHDKSKVQEGRKLMQGQSA